VVSQTYCLIPEVVLRASPWNLLFDKLIQAKVQACNQNGCSASSALNLVGARVQTEPTGLITLQEGLSTNQTQITVSWNALTSHSDTRGA
jgi:hypothetical protein